jgi:arylesterase / paraoxonase
VYYDGTAFREVAGGLAYANGINVSPDGGTLFVAGTLDRAVHVYRRDKATGALELVRSVGVGTGADNIELDEAGNLWVGAHPKLVDFLRHARDAEHRSPSQVLKLVPRGDGDYGVEEVYLNGGRPLSGSSVAAVCGGVLLIGSVFEGVLRCKAPAPGS